VYDAEDEDRRTAVLLIYLKIQLTGTYRNKGNLSRTSNTHTTIN